MKEDEVKSEVGKVKCAVYSRVVGYIRPLASWNIAKKVEFKERQTYKLKPLEEEPQSQPQLV